MNFRRLVGATIALFALTSCAQHPADSPPVPEPTVSEPEPSPTPDEPTCAEVAAELSVEQQVGQLLMIGVYGSLDAGTRESIGKHGVGSVILMGNYESSVSQIGELSESIAELGEAAPVLIAVDQEGGLVRRLRGPGFDEIPSAAEQGKLSDAELSEEAKIWAEQLKAAGIDLVLAPVGDTVPESKMGSNEPIGKLGRAYGSDPEVVAAKVAAFVSAFKEIGVATSVKHFPTLGEVTGNTDFASGVTDSVTAPDSKALEPFRAGIEAGSDTIMMSTAIYTKIDPDVPAAFSPKVVGLLRDDLGFDKVIISDDLGVAVSAKSTPARERALRFVKAGGDLAITVDPKLASEMVEGLLEAAGEDPAVAEQVAASAGRVLAMKSGLGLTDCRVE